MPGKNSNNSKTGERLKIIACIQARMGSRRLKKKALVKIAGRTMTEQIFRRLQVAKELDDIILATSKEPDNNILASHASEIGLKCYRGPEEDLIARFSGAAQKLGAHAIVRITGDCPLVDPCLLDRMIRFYRKSHGKFDLLTNIFPPSFPHGLALEILPFAVLKILNSKVKNPLYREWLTCYVMERPDEFRIVNFKGDKNLSMEMRWTVDYPEDVVFINEIFKALGKKDKIFLMDETIAFLEKNPQLLKINAHRIDKTVKKGIHGKSYHQLKQSYAK